MWPYAEAALYGLRVEMPEMGRHLGTARSLTATLAAVPGIEILPDPPQTPIFNLVFDRPAEALVRARDRVAKEADVWLFDRMWPTDSAGRTRIEFAVGRQVAEFADGEVRALLLRLLELSDGG